MGLLQGLSKKRTGSAAAGILNKKMFEYVAVSSSGVRQKGKMQATSAQDVSTQLQADGWMPLSVTDLSGSAMNVDLSAMFGSGQKSVKLSVHEASTFFRQAAELLKAGVSMPRIMQTLGEEAPEKIKTICDGLTERIAAGVSLSEAMESFPEAFDKVVRAYVASGELSGTLPATMARLAKTLEKRHEMRLKIKGVTAYPKMVSIAIGGIVLAILKFMVPMYDKIYTSFGAKLPAPTRALIGISKNLSPVSFSSSFPTPFFVADAINFGIIGLLGRVIFLVGFIVGMDKLRNRSGKVAKRRNTIIKWIFVTQVTLFAGNYVLVPIATGIWLFFITIFAGIKFATISADKNPKMARRVDMIRFKLPLFGGMARMNALYQWSSTMSGALSSGVPLVRALALAGATAGSRWHASLIEPLAAAVVAGTPFSEALANYPELYPPTLRAMVATGEITGELPVMFDNVSNAIQSDIDALVAGLSAKIEVGLLVVMGVVVGGLLVALYLPIINLATTAQNSG